MMRRMTWEQDQHIQQEAQQRIMEQPQEQHIMELQMVQEHRQAHATGRASQLPR